MKQYAKGEKQALLDKRIRERTARKQERYRQKAERRGQVVEGAAHHAKAEKREPPAWLKEWQPAEQVNIAAFMAALDKASNGTVYVPAMIDSNGNIEGIRQFEVIADGPDQGHWSTVNGKRKWFKGDHNYPRQLDQKSLEHVNETRVMNRNVKLDLLGDVKRNRFTGKSYKEPSKKFETEARIVRYGMVKHVKKAPGCAAARAFERAAKHIENKTANFLAVNTPAPDNSIESQVQSGAGMAISPVGCEAHV